MRAPSILPSPLRATALALGLALSLATATHAAGAPFSKASLPPIVIVPGAPGTELIDGRTGQRVWPSAWLMAYPMDGNDRLALPLEDPESTPIVAGKLLREVRVGRLRFPIHVYDGLEQRLRELGYREGDWQAPSGAGEYFYFPYDWRQSVEASGRRFSRDLAALYRRMPPDTPPAVVLGHSLGGLVARYALMYGDAALGTDGPLPPVTWAGGPHIGTLFLVATPNEGTFTALKCLEKGTFYFWRHGAFSPATLFTFRSIFDMLPERIEPLIDRRGKALPFRFDDAEDWERLGWSVIDRRHNSPALHAKRRAHLEQELARHKRLQTALAQLAGTPNPAALYVVGSLSQTVQRTALVESRGGRMKVRFDPPSGDRQSLEPLLFEPGDTMVPDRSLTAKDSAHDPAGSLCFRSVRHSTRSHQALLSSPEILAALDEVIAPAQDAGTLKVAGAAAPAAPCVTPAIAAPLAASALPGSAAAHKPRP
jgi:pimeloyl-ACP methyl ester carboxylesterase